ncbi:MAG TPA: hypothetical protein VGM17_05240 [Rhizomicrobium sp.]
MTFELDEGFYQSQSWCDACGREVRRFFFVKRARNGQLWGRGMTEAGAEWMCDQIDKSWSDAFPDHPYLSNEVLNGLVTKMPDKLWDGSFLYDTPPTNALLAAIRAMTRELGF